MTATGSILGSARRSWTPARYPVWGPRRPHRDGYTLAVPVPGDLPVFTSIALAVCRLQDPGHRIETFVVPDQPTEDVGRLVSAAAADWPGPLRVLDLPRVDRVVLPRLRDAGKNHGAQIVAAIRASAASHVVMHDADLFLQTSQVHRDEWEYARAHSSAAVGVDPAWDPWFAAHDRHLVATWEMCANIDWLRATPPWRLFGRDARMFGERHTFDTTFWAQSQTHPSRLTVLARPGEVVHFNYVISSYRRFQRWTAGQFADTNLRLLLIRLFIDLFDPERPGYAVPDRAELVRGLDDPTAAVTYATVEPAVYRDFRSKVDGILTGGWVDEDRRDRAVHYLDPFDARFQD